MVFNNTHQTSAAEQGPYRHGSDSVVAVEKGSENDSKVPRLTFRTFFMCILVSMGGICFGYDTGQISGFLEMQDFLENFADIREPELELSWKRSGLIVGMLSIGTLFGALASAPIANQPRIGRKRSIWIWCIVFIIGNIIQAASKYPRWYEMMVGRIIAGAGIGGMSVLVPMYQGESAPTHVRGAIVCCYQLFITIGILLANLVNFGTEKIPGSASWQIPIGISFLFPLVLSAGMLILPETPRFEYSHGKVDSARTSIARFYGVGENHRVINNHMNELEEKHAAEIEGGERPWSEVFTAPRMRYRLLLGIFIQAQLTGANYFFYYGTTIFSSVGLENPYITQIILGAVNVFCTFPGLYMVEKWGRRKCLVSGALWMCMCFLVFASMGHFKLINADGSNNATTGYVMIVFACLFIAAFASTWGPMAWACVAEMYPGRYRSQGIAFCSASNWLFNFYLAFCTPLIDDQISFAYGYVFAATNLIAAAVIYFFLLESQNKSLEEIDTMYLLHVKPTQSSKWTPTPGEDLVTVDKFTKRSESGAGLARHVE